MKLDELKKIIKEELASALKENTEVAPAETKPGTKEAPPTTKPGKRRQIGNPTIPKTSPIPIKNQNLSEAEKELANKIAQRFLKLKK